VATVRHSAPGILLAAALAVLTAACGPSNPPPPKAVMLDAKAVVDPLAGDTSVWILHHASTDTEAAFAVHLTGSGQDSGHTVTFDLSIAGSDGCAGKVTEAQLGSFRLLFDGSTVWVQPDDEFWRVASGVTDPARLAAVEGKYLTAAAGGSGLGEIASLCQLNAALKAFTSIPAGTQGETKGPVTRINGQRVLKVVDAPDSEYAYVTDTAQPRLLQVVDGSSDGGELSFGYPGTPVAISPPPASEIVSAGQ
jgi:hypothetical protein